MKKYQLVLTDTRVIEFEAEESAVQSIIESINNPNFTFLVIAGGIINRHIISTILPVNE